MRVAYTWPLFNVVLEIREMRHRGVDGHTDTLIAILRTSTWGEVWASADSSIMLERKQRASMDGKTASLFFLTIRHIQCDGV